MEGRSYSHRLAAAANQNIKEKNYWLKKLSGNPVKTSLLYDFKKAQGAEVEVSMGTLEFQLTGELFSKLMALSNKFDYTLHIVLVSGLVVLLEKYTQTRDILICSPIYKQEKDIEFINTVLVLRNQVKEFMTFKELLLQTKQTVVEATEHQNYPLQVLMDQLNSSGPGSFQTDNTLFDIVLLLENIHDRKYIQDADYHILFSFLRTDETIEGRVEYDIGLYRKETIERVVGHFTYLVEKAVSDVNTRLEDIDLLSEEEKEQILYDFNDTALEYPEGKTLVRLFEEQAARTPDGVSIVGSWQLTVGKKERSEEPVQLTYKELNKKSNQLAHFLRSRGVTSDTIVGILVEPSIDMIVGILGILKAGGAYLPIDPNYPQERIDFMLKDSGTRLLVSELSKVSGGIEVVKPGELSEEFPIHLTHLTHPTHLCYVIYTSGTTGRPKGVVVEHRNVIINLFAFYREFNIKPTDTVIQLSSYTFDASVEEICPVLLRGGKLAIPAVNERLDIHKLVEFIVKHKVNIIDCTPLLLNEFNKTGGIKGTHVHTFISGGDVLKEEYVDRLVEAGKVYNTYGPTESTVCAAYYRHCGSTGTGIPIGKPIANYSVYILDENMRLLPVGVIGEICVAGPGVTRGYLNQPELTAEKFLPVSYRSNRSYRTYISQKIYKTGDLGRWLPDGNIEYIGRKDLQVKIRGFRIETGEIESLLKRKAGIKEVVVTAREDKDGKKYLCAYWVSEGGGDADLREQIYDESELREFLQTELPEYMIPSFFVFLDKFPLTLAGKVDRRALPKPEVKTAAAYVEPQDGLQERVWQIWHDIFDLDRIGIYDNFFEIGGHSLRGLQVVNGIQKEFGVKLPIAEIFKHPTIKELSEVVKDAARQSHSPIEPVEEREYYELSHSQKRVWVVSQFEGGLEAFNMPAAYFLEGVLDRGAFENVFATLLERHESLRTVFITIHGEPKQIIKLPEEIGFKIEISDFSQVKDGEARAAELADAEENTRFDLARGPLLRARLLRFEKKKHVFLFNMHHIISDALSIDVLLSEMLALYEVYRQGANNSLEPLQIQYKDFAAWQNRQLSETEAENHKDFWMKQLHGVLPELDLPVDKERPAVMNYRGDTLSLHLDKEMTRKLRELGSLSGQRDVTLFMTLLAALNVLLYGYTGQTDIIIGTTIAGREHADLENQIGFYLNTLALRTRFKPGDTFIQLLQKTREVSLSVYNHQVYPFDKLVEDIGLERDISKHPIFNVLLNMINYNPSQTGVSTSSLLISPFEAGYHKTKFDLTVYVYEGENTLTLTFEYNVDLFENKTILLMLKRFQALLGDMVRDFSIPISHMLLKDKINLLPITPIIPEVDHFDASYHQERLWFIDAFEAGHLYESSPIYHNIPLILKISGPLDVEVLEKSIRQVIARHKALRTRIVTVDNKSVQVVDPDIDFKFNLQVIEGGSGTFAEAVEQAVAESKRPFSMDKEPLIRGRLIRWEHQWFLLGITFHHITADKKSLELFVQETALIYDALIHNKNPNIPDLPFHYVDFSRWQSEFSEEAVDTLLFYWRRKLHGKLQALELPTDRPRAKIHTFREARQSFTFPESLTGWMKTYVQQEGADEFVLLLSVFKVLLHVYCAQDEIIVGTTVDNRHHPGRENMMGPAANLLVLRSFISGSDSFKKVIDDVQRTVKEAYRYRDMPFDRLVLALNPDIDMSRTALFDVLFRYEEKPFLKTSMGNVEVEVMETNLGWGKYDLNVLVQKKASEEEFLEGVLVYNADYYDASRIRRLIDHYRVLLEAVLDAPLQPISRFEILTPQERQQLLWEWNGKTADYPQDKQIHEIFEHQVSRTPDHIAMEGAHELHELPEMSITYSELDRKSNQLAHLLREKGVLADSIVAIMMDRSIDMIIGIIGILKARGAYLPIDPDYPHDRIDYMLKDSNAWVLVSELSEVSKVSEETEIVRLSELSEEHPTHLTYPTHPTHLCYIIYTSGTTGRPKGVMVEHRNVVSLFFNNGFQFDFNSMDVWTMFHSHCFDFSVWEIFGALLYGGKLIVVPKMVAMDTEQYVSMVRQYGVTVLNQTPSAFYRFIDVEVNQEKQDLPVRYVIFGGEALSPGKLKEWRERYPQTRLINMFGITETTVHVTYKEITGREIEENLSHIGKPIPTLTSYVMDIHQRLLPVGVYGELYVGGAGVSRGYLNQPQLTAERFPENPHRLGETLYRSGDLVRLLENGEMVYSGRIDHQVQLRGFRVELEEIRNQLLKIAGIRDAVVVDKEDASGDIYLCAYIAADEAVKPAEARHLLGRVLPDYMIPAYVIKINKIPLTPNGKVDRKALPEPEFKAAEEDLAAPLDVLQQKLVEIWADVLNIEKENIGINTSFFDMGGHSLKATILAARVHKELNVQLPLAQVFTTPTIKELSNYIRRTKRERYISIEPAEEKEYYPLSSTQKRLYILQQLASDSPYYNMPDVIEPEESIDEEKLEAVFKKMIERHEVLRTSFEMVAEEPVQRVHKEVKFKIEVKVEKEILSSETLIEHFIRPFDLSQAPLLRAKLIKTPRGRPILLIDMHHIITDATSQEILKKGFYALCSGEQLPDLRLQYKDYSEWQYSREQEEVVKEQEAYWIKEFSHDLPVLNLPTDYPRPLLQRFEGHWVNFALNTEETRILKTIAQENDGTLYMCLLAVFNVLFSKLSGQEDIILGTPIAARRHADLQYVVGMLLNTLPMRNYPSAHKPFNQFFEEVKKRTLEAYENQEYPFENLVGNLLVDRDTSRNPVFDVMLVLMNQAEYSGEISEMPVQPPYRHLKRTSRFDMSFVAVDMGKNLYFGLEYSTNLFIPSTIEKYITYFKNIIRHLGSDMQQKISDIEYITREEKEAILELSSGVREIPSVDLTVHEIFEEEAGQVPDNTALVFEGQHMSYGELNRRSNRLARVLREKGVRANAVVGVMVERSIEMIIALLAVLKAGGAYVPIDPEYPEQRILTMLEDSRASLLITTGNLVGRFSVTALKGMKGVKQEEELVVTPPQAQIKDFDAIPIPDRTLIDYEKYHRYIGEAPAKNTITMQATRGCPYNCLYCHKIWPKTHVARSSENVFKEISYAYEAGVRRFVFIDDIFNLDKKNAERLLETIVKSGLDIRLFFPNGFRADILSRDFIDLMMVAGTVNLDVALESASPRIQRLIKKNLNLERFKENVDYITRKYPQVILEMEMMHGFPTETEKEAMMTLDFLKEFRWVHFPNLHVLKIFPNTDMCRFAIESGISEAVIERSVDLAFHELPDTLPFPKSFTRQFQAKFMGEYFLLKERLLDVLPHQMKVLTEDELVQKYDSYLPFDVRHFSDILDYAGISRQELGDMEPCPEATYRVPDFCNRISKHFPVKKPAKEAFRILLLDLSQLFIEEQEHMLHHQIEEPLGLLYLMSYLNEKFKDRISGKVFKSRIDFDSYDELKRIIMDFNPDLIGIRTLSFYKEFFHRAVLMMRQWGVDVPIVTGGPYATSDYKLILQDPNVDLVVLGEGELTLGELVETMMENGNKLPGEEVLKEIQGIAFSIDKGKFKEPEKQRTSDILLLDELRSTRLEEYPGQNLYPINQPANLFYVIYTSGSTGKPKGVMLEHRNIANLVRYQYNHTNIDFDRVLQFTTISFDVSAQEIFSTLLAGGRLVLISKETLNDIPELFRVVEKENIKTLFAAASFLKFVMNEEEYVGLVPGCLKHIVTAGEQLIVNERFRKYLRENNVYLHNHYGPSETHVVTALTLDPEGEIPELPSIGRPITNTAIYILNRGLHLVPAGVAGELVISGQQVGRGYIYQPGLTSEKFKRAVISHSSLVIGSFYSSQETNDQSPMTNDRLYRTGDLARWLQDRNLEFLGRLDHQVKVRGFRVELGEIEGQLLNHHQIKECVVVAGEDERGGRYLCAYIVSRQELEVSELREYLGRDLPDYMIPSYFVFLENIPLTPNRKIDRGALPAPEMKAVDNYIAPETLWEEKLVEIWSEVLGIGRDVISVESNFFELGGHSLTATILAAKVNKEFQVRVPLVEIFQAPTIRGLSQYLQGAVEDGYSSIEPVEKKEYYVLSSAQKRLYILHQMDVNSTVYNMLDIIPLAKAPDVEKLEETFKKLICCHEILRTSFEMVNGEPIQGIHEEVEFKIEGRGGSLCPPFDRDRDKGSRGELPLQYNEIIESFIRPFDLSEAPLLRVALFKTEEENHLLLVDMHHIICDGISHRVLVQDFNALVGGEELESLRIQYKDFAEWQCSEQETERLKQQEVYWLDRFRGEVPVLDLPLDFPRPAVQSFAGSRIYFEIGKEETGALKRMALEERATLFMVLLAVTNILLSKLSGQQDIVIGTPIAGRRNADMQKMIGMFVNTLALRNEPGDELCFSEFLRDLKGHTLAAFENQEYPFEELVEKVSLDRDVSRNPLFDVMMVLQNFAEFQEKSRVRKIIGKEAVELTTTKFDLTLEAVEAGSRLILIFNYCTALFKPQTIERFITYFKNIIKEITGNTKIKISDIEIIPPEEKDRILYDFNNTETEYPGGKTIHELFEEQVERTPDNVAVVASCQLAVGAAAFPANKGESSGETVQLAYKELNEKSNRLALVLIEKGVLADDIVVIMVERSIEMIIGILGILKAGGAYLPIDPDYPQERIDYMLKDSNAKVLLAAPAAQVKVEAEVKEDSIERIDISNLLSSSTLTLTSTLSKVSSANLAYIIYTSGTTGRPKGVGVEHRQAVNTLLYRGEVYGMNTGHISLQLFSFSFDGFVTSFFTPVIAGAKVVLPGKDEVKDIRLIKDIIARYGVTHFISIPGFYQAVLDSLGLEDLKSLKVVTLAGDKLPHHLLECSRETNKDIEIAHEYGVTEAAVMSTLYRHQERDNQVKIGGPIGNVGIVIVDRNGCMQPVELPGEICIFGAGVACGYLSNPELTAEKFRRAFICHSSFVIRSSESTNDQYLMTNDRLYLTGDLARWLADGNIEFLGRIDHQVKIRGFRIELEEIENRLSAHPGIKRAVVIDWKSPGGEKYLCAYIVSQMLLSADSLEAFLSQSLPDYMIPSYFVPLEEIPLTPNGKIDRKALPAPGLKQEECIAPRNPIEKKLVEIWSVVLEVEKEKIGIDDNFFHLGGHSLKAAFVMSRINRELGVRVPLVEVFQTPTIRELSEYITGTKEEISIIKDDQLVLLKKGWGRVEPFFFIHDGSGEVEGYIEFCNRLSGAYDFWGIRAQTIENYAPLNLSIEELARRYIETIRVVQAHGPYRIAGWSIGGTIGFEMVRQLEEENEEVCFLGLIDTVPPDKDFPEKGIEFNLENELKLIRDYFPGEAITKKLKGIGDFSRVWPEVAAYLESGGFWLEHDTDSMFKNVVPGDFARTVPNLEQMSIKEFIIYLNMVRTFDNARNNYIPGRKIDTAVHFFKATDGEVIDAEKWNIYCDKPVKVYDIPGDHFSLLKMPEVVKFAKLFAKMINK